MDEIHLPVPDDDLMPSSLCAIAQPPLNRARTHSIRLPSSVNLPVCRRAVHKYLASLGPWSELVSCHWRWLAVFGHLAHVAADPHSLVCSGGRRRLRGPGSHWQLGAVTLLRAASAGEGVELPACHRGGVWSFVSPAIVSS